MPPEPARIGFTPVTPEHYDLLGTWLAAPHVLEWWGDPEEELGHVRDMVDRRDTTRPFLILLDGAPVGYIQHWFIGHHQNEQWTIDNPWLLELPPETVGVDLFIGDPARLSRGIGSTALTAFVGMLRELGHRTIVIDPDPANVRAVRAYGKAGFSAVPALLGRTADDVLIMQHHLKANEIS